MGSRDKEIELKFSGDSGVIAGLPQSAFLRALNAGEGGWARLVSTYYDTAEGALRRERVSLRLRREGGRNIQAVKRAGDDAALLRDEWETEIVGEGGFPAATGKAGVDRLIAKAAPRLTPVVRMSIDRWTSVIHFGDARIELAVDLGCGSASNGPVAMVETPIAEAELELLDGPPRDLFKLARLFAENAPLRLQSRTKIETLRAGAIGRCEPSAERSFSFARETPAGEALQQQLLGLTARLTNLQAVMLDARKVEGVHQLRVAMRRLQAVERAFRPLLNTQEIRGLTSRGRSFRQALGDARDWDVFLLETLPQADKHGYAPEGARRLAARAESLRAEAWARADRVIRSPEFTRFLIDLAEAASLADWRQQSHDAIETPLSAFAPKALDRERKKVAKVARKIPRRGIASYHPLRIALKKFRYPTQLFRSIYPVPARKPYMRALSALQDEFGRINDAASAEALANRAALGEGEAAMRAAGFICGYRIAEAEAAARKIDAAWPDFEAMEPFWRE